MDLNEGPCSCDDECAGTNVVCNQELHECDCEPGFVQSEGTCVPGKISHRYPDSGDH